LENSIAILPNKFSSLRQKKLKTSEGFCCLEKAISTTGKELIRKS
jgi:hypothetical protein